MHPEIDFQRADFRSLNSEQQLAKCREMACEAERLASKGGDEFHAHYSDLARRWSDLADEIEHALTNQNQTGVTNEPDR